MNTVSVWSLKKGGNVDLLKIRLDVAKRTFHCRGATEVVTLHN